MPACCYPMGQLPHTLGGAGSGDCLPILCRTHSDPISRLETVQSHFQTEGEINNILIYEL